MNHFRYRHNRLHGEGISLTALARRYGTPLYVYSYATMAKHFNRILQAWQGYPVTIAYSCKANSNLGVLACLRGLGSSVDIVSQGELHRALWAGFTPSRIIFGGVGKTDDELETAIRKKISLIIADSFDELQRINQLGRRRRVVVPVGLRINPDINPRTHPYIATALATGKFGTAMADAPRILAQARRLSFLEIIGIHQHIGSQIIRLSPFIAALQKTCQLIEELRRQGLPIKVLDIGGGIGITYRREKPFALEVFARRLLPIIRPTGCRLILEPGRVIVGNAGILLTRVLSCKTVQRKTIIIVDAAMNDLIRPALYGAYHEIRPVQRGHRWIRGDVVGPVCETGDFLARNRRLPAAAPGDYLAVMSAGAYGFSMASNYNSRLRPAEVLVRGRRVFLVRRRENFRDLVRGETTADRRLSK